MTTMVTAGTPLAEALGHVIPPKLVEMGWSSDGGDDSALTDYVILMLANGKTQEQIAGELSNDLLGGLGEGDTQALDFSRWLFEQVEILNQQINGGGAPAPNEASPAQAIPSFGDQESAPTQMSGFDGNAQDADMSMGDAAQGDSIPTGPKAMRNGRGGGRGRMLNQINRSMDRGDSALHRVRGQAGGGRVNSHGREHGKGRFNQNGGGRMPGGRQMGGMNMGNMMNMTQSDQMHLMSLLEEQARMMAQIMPGFVPPAINPAFQQNGSQNGRSLFDRVERQHGHRHRGQRHNNHHEQSGDVDMDTKPDQGGQEGGQDESNTNTVCRFNLRCTRKDCPFAHQSPAAPEGSPVDVSDICTYGAACKNRKCTGRHPSPAVKSAHQAEELCRFFPNCANPHCHFKHPSMPLCRNGADCSQEGCKFTHIQTPCKFTPCLNPSCPYKHAEGQKGAFSDKVWTPGSKEHVSERKFVAEEEGTEELIKPDTAGEGSQSQEIAT